MRPPAEIEKAAAPYFGQLVTKIMVSGNNVTPTEEIINVLKTKPGMTLTSEGLGKDLYAIYNMGWFYDLQPEFKQVPEGVQVTYHVMENPIYQQLAVEGNTKISTEKIESLLDLPKNQLINIREVNAKVQRLEAEYNKEGYILARVADIRMQPDGTLLLVVNEGIVEDFKIKGNTKTKDYVIIREMKLKKGEPFNAKDARRSMQRIYNLGYFEDVNIKLNPGQQPNAVEIEISVVEMNTGTFGIGAGYSDADGFIGMVSVGDKISVVPVIKLIFAGNSAVRIIRTMSSLIQNLGSTVKKQAQQLLCTTLPTNMQTMTVTPTKLPVMTKNVVGRN